eukprot:CAMPEP_0170199280 /NCGR_PEP_ID=MMETSP0040_2-20121228/69245_1 /TAXON_ID=641309 /ORGANISM="Lotharella oceanica, Strain CCMP622" /LENGTH=518 /DNA_ID=CAMNT_0010449383 /DNA_START=148 /DNA_END=1705 /DNA_ORIENTATION=-
MRGSSSSKKYAKGREQRRSRRRQKILWAGGAFLMLIMYMYYILPNNLVVVHPRKISKIEISSSSSSSSSSPKVEVMDVEVLVFPTSVDNARHEERVKGILETYGAQHVFTEKDDKVSRKWRVWIRLIDKHGDMMAGDDTWQSYSRSIISAEKSGNRGVDGDGGHGGDDGGGDGDDDDDDDDDGHGDGPLVLPPHATIWSPDTLDPTPQFAWAVNKSIQAHEYRWNTRQQKTPDAATTEQIDIAQSSSSLSSSPPSSSSSPSSSSASSLWIVKVDTITFIMIEHLLSYLSTLDSHYQHFLGRRLRIDQNLLFLSGGAGFVASGVAAERYLEYWPTCFEQRIKADNWMRGARDVGVTYCATKAGIEANRTMDSHGRQRFHIYGPSKTYQGSVDGWVKDYSVQIGEPIQKGPNCCSPVSVTFHYVEGPEMVFIHRVLHNRSAWLQLKPEEVSKGGLAILEAIRNNLPRTPLDCCCMTLRISRRPSENSCMAVEHALRTASRMRHACVMHASRLHLVHAWAL